MHLSKYLFGGTFVLLAAFSLSARTPEDSTARPDPRQLLGRWDLTVNGAAGDHPAWLEVRQSGYRTLVGTLVWQFGSARPIGQIHFQDGAFHFAVPPQWEPRKDDLRLDGKLDRDTLQGSTTDEKGNRIAWTGRRAPALKRDKPPTWGSPVSLFNEKDLAGWKPRSPSARNGWLVKDGILANAQPGNDLMTEEKFTDFQLYAEFRYPRRSNSGIYLRGRYELQIEDNFGDEPDCHKIGGIYGFLMPSVNAAKKAGEWQTLDLMLVGRVLSATLNSERILDRQTIPGITGGALDSDEGAPGPILLQGDHGPIEFRKLILTPAS